MTRPARPARRWPARAVALTGLGAVAAGVVIPAAARWGPDPDDAAAQVTLARAAQAARVPAIGLLLADGGVEVTRGSAASGGPGEVVAAVTPAGWVGVVRSASGRCYGLLEGRERRYAHRSDGPCALEALGPPAGWAETEAAGWGR